jgi:hypothetical protein
LFETFLDVVKKEKFCTSFMKRICIAISFGTIGLYLQHISIIANGVRMQSSKERSWEIYLLQTGADRCLRETWLYPGLT